MLTIPTIDLVFAQAHNDTYKLLELKPNEREGPWHALLSKINLSHSMILNGLIMATNLAKRIRQITAMCLLLITSARNDSRGTSPFA